VETVEVVRGLVLREGGGVRSSREGGQVSCGEDGLGRRKMAETGGAADVVRMVWWAAAWRMW
jgi:hypothetical protein